AIGLEFKAHRQLVPRSRILPLRLPHLLLQSKQVLHVMANLVRQDVGLGEVSRGAEPAFQFVVEAEIDVYLLISGAIKRSRSGLRHATSRIHRITKKHQLGMPVLRATSSENLSPSVLRVIKDE